MRIQSILFTLVLATVLSIGCAKKPSKDVSPGADAVTTASIVNTPETFEKAVGKDGTWIIALLSDLTVDKELVLEGDFKNSKGKTQRKLALYNQDTKQNITAKYTLTIPKLTIDSPEASIQHGTLKGDIYVSASNFKLIDSKVDGNVYFKNSEAQSTFTMDEQSSVTGVQELKQ